MFEEQLTISKESEVSYTLIARCNDIGDKLAESVFAKRTNIPVELAIFTKGCKKNLITRTAIIDVVDDDVVITILNKDINESFTFEMNGTYLIEVSYRCGNATFVSDDIGVIALLVMVHGPGTAIQTAGQLPLLLSHLTIAEAPYTPEQLNDPEIAEIVRSNTQEEA